MRRVLLRAAGCLDRDFLLCRPTEDLEGVLPVMAKYPVASLCSQALFGCLRKVVLCQKSGTWEFDEAALVDPVLSAVWTEHSERCTLRSWAAAAGISLEVVRQLEGWQPRTDEQYLRQQRSLVESAQSGIADFIKKARFWGDVLDVRLVVEAMAARLQLLGLAAAEWSELLAGLAYFETGSADVAADAALAKLAEEPLVWWTTSLGRLRWQLEAQWRLRLHRVERTWV